MHRQVPVSVDPSLDTVAVPPLMQTLCNDDPAIVPPKVADWLLALANAYVPIASAAYPPTAPVTNAVVAICVVLVPAAAVGAMGVPVRVGLAKGA